MVCLKCNSPMDYLGNIDHIVYPTDPPQWDEIWVCHKCKLKKTIRVYGASTLDSREIDLSEYHEILEK